MYEQYSRAPESLWIDKNFYLVRAAYMAGQLISTSITDPICHDLQFDFRILYDRTTLLES
jgi:hypothetical protein